MIGKYNIKVTIYKGDRVAIGRGTVDLGLIMKQIYPSHRITSQIECFFLNIVQVQSYFFVIIKLIINRLQHG